MLGLFTFGATPVSTRHGCGICVQYGQPIWGAFNKIDGVMWIVLMIVCNQCKSECQIEENELTFVYKFLYDSSSFNILPDSPQVLP